MGDLYVRQPHSGWIRPLPMRLGQICDAACVMSARRNAGDTQLRIARNEEIHIAWQSVRETSAAALSNSSRTAARRIRRRYASGETPTKVLKCLRRVRAATPDRRTSSAMVTTRSMCSRINAMAFLRSGGTTIEAVVGAARFAGRGGTHRLLRHRPCLSANHATPRL
jgi:hypothetical protein